MEHPLISSLDHLTVDELTDKLNDLNQKLAIASRIGNGYLCDQLRMAIESHQTKFQEKIKAQYDEVQKKFDNSIKIT
jgi:hypothetical protein